MSRILGFLLHPTAMLVLIATAIALATAPAGEKVVRLALYSTAALASAEILVAAHIAYRSRSASAVLLAHSLLGIGALVVGYALFRGAVPLVGAVGSLVMGAGVVLLGRDQGTAR